MWPKGWQRPGVLNHSCFSYNGALRTKEGNSLSLLRTCSEIIGFPVHLSYVQTDATTPNDFGSSGSWLISVGGGAQTDATTPKNLQQRTCNRVCKRTQHATSNNVASVCTRLYCKCNGDFINNDSFFSLCFSFLNAIREAEFKSKAEMANHLLLFVSALVPKALASLMTSFCIELAKPENVSKIIVYTMKISSSNAFYPSFPFF